MWKEKNNVLSKFQVASSIFDSFATIFLTPRDITEHPFEDVPEHSRRSKQFVRETVNIRLKKKKGKTRGSKMGAIEKDTEQSGQFESYFFVLFKVGRRPMPRSMLWSER